MTDTSKDLFAKLTEALNGGADTVPPGFRTRLEWQKEWACSAAHAKRLIAIGVQNGLMEVATYRILRVNGYGRVQHYRPVQAGMPLKKGVKKP